MSSSSRNTRIAIIGGGYCGVMTAVQLSRLSAGPLQLTLINHQRPTARGVAYGTRRAEHLLNVAARNMSAFPDQPDHFVNWLRTRSEYDLPPENELRERFIPRLIYGDYLRGLMQQHLQGTTMVDGEAVDVAPQGRGAVIHLADGRRVEAERIVLATGNEAPAELPGTETLLEHVAWVGDPWQAWESRRPPRGGTIVILGTGLTTVDAVLTLGALGWQGVVHAVSRHGWLPHAHFRGIEYADFPPAGVDLADLGLVKLIALLELHCARLRELGAHPAIIVDKLRPHTQRIWQRFTREERMEFARDHAARWNVLRHRIAPEIHAQLTTAQLTGQLQIHAAGIVRVEADGDRVRVHLRSGKALAGDLVINATGPHTSLAATRSRLLQNLLRRGLATPDDLGMGLRVEADLALVDRDGQRSRLLLALGSLLRGTLWETIAVPELRGQAKRVAETLLDQPAATAETPPEVMMEYMI